MKAIKNIIRLGVLIVMIAGISSCSKDNNTASTYDTDKTVLNHLIDSATTVAHNAVEGKQAGQYVKGSIAMLNNVTSMATQVSNTNVYTQREVDNAVANYERAFNTFYSRQILEVSADNLVGYWKFTGNANDSSVNGFNGTLKSGITGPSTAPVDGGVLPQLTTDRYGNANNAYAFDNGAYIEIPYNVALNPKSFTISVWIKRNTTFSDNYIFSLDRWNGFKFQLQSNNFMFLTLHNDNGYTDQDSNPAQMPENEWAHGAVTFTNGEMKFYLNGELKRTIAVTGNPVTVAPPINLCIGQQLPKDKFNFTDTNDPNYYWGPSYFKGSLDDLRFYNKALSDNEIISIYTMESYKD